MRGLHLLFGVIVVVVLSTFVVSALSTSGNPEFELTNSTEEQVVVAATWSEYRRDIGAFAAGATRTIKVRDESALIFEVLFSDGRLLASDPVYFVSGLRYTGVIYPDRLDLTQVANAE